MSPVLVTGGSGYLGTQLIAALLRDGRPVRATVRSLEREDDVDTLQALAYLRAMGVGIEDIRTYQANRTRGHDAAGEQRDLLLRHAERIEAQIATLHIHLGYLHAKAALWDARDHGDPGAEAEANLRVQDMYPRLEELVLR